MPLRCRKSVTHQMIAEVSKGAAALREACAAEPAYQTADDLWKGLKRNDLAAQLVLTFAQRLRFNKRTRHSLPAAKRQEDKRWVRILRQEGWNLYLLMRQWAVPNRKKPGNKTGYLTQTERRTKVRLGQADAAADTMDKQAAAALKATWSLVLSSCCVLWIDNWYRAHRPSTELSLLLHFGRETAMPKKKTGTGHNTRHDQTKVTGHKTVLQ